MKTRLIQNRAVQRLGMSRRRFVFGAGVALAAAGLTPVLPDWAALRRLGLGVPPAFAATGVVLDTANPLANFTQETITGQKIFPTPTVLTIQDGSPADINNLYAQDPDAAPGVEIDLVVTSDVSDFIPINADIGVRFVINDGQTSAAQLTCVIINGAPGVAIAKDLNYNDPTNYAAFVPVNWLATTTVRFRRLATGGAEIMEVNSVAPNPRALHTGPFAARTRPVAGVEFGCASVEAQATIDVRTFYSERPQPPVQGTLTPTVLRIRDSLSNQRQTRPPTAEERTQV